MNLKKAKRLRKLVHHLMDTGDLEKMDWHVYASATSGASMLHPSCGRAIYQKMKKNTAERVGHHIQGV